MNYKLEEYEDGRLILTKDGNELLCPWNNDQALCGSWCSLFRWRVGVKTIEVRQECGSSSSIFIDKVVDEQTQAR